MTAPQIGEHVETERGGGVIEHVYARVTSIQTMQSHWICTVKLDTPFLDRQEKVVSRIEYLLPVEQEQSVNG